MAGTEAAGAGDAPDLIERALAPEDAAALAPLSDEAGWNQVAADWRFMLEAGEGKGLADPAGRMVASALIVPLGYQLSWISMVLTAKPWRGHGFGTHLLQDRIARVRATGAAAGLDATELGRPIYAALGFRVLYELRRWHVKRPPLPAAPPHGVTLRPMRPDDLEALAEFDRRLTSFDRPHVLRHLHQRAAPLAHVAEAGGRIAGFVLGRDGRFAAQIGPIVAADAATALALAARAAGALRPPFILDVPDRQAGMIRWIAAAGGEAPRRFWRMILGDAPGLADDRHVFALAGPELA
jgi:GNAT superfamily N-acetyltransferase